MSSTTSNFVEDPEEILAHKLELEAIRDEIESANTPVVPPLAIGQYGAATAAVNRGGIQGSVPLPRVCCQMKSGVLPYASFQLLPLWRCLMSSCVIVPGLATQSCEDTCRGSVGLMVRQESARSKPMDHVAVRALIVQHG